jgi:hypothetical protein
MDTPMTGIKGQWFRWIWFAVGLVLVGGTAARAQGEPPLTLTIEGPQTAGICGFRALWDTPIPLDENGPVEIKDAKVKDRGGFADWSVRKRGANEPAALAFDALQRSLLVRFPKAAEKIATQIQKGYAVQKVELVLPFKDTELWPPGEGNYPAPDGYLFRMNFGVDEMWRDRLPQWHAVAWALRQPWKADAKMGPTFNAYINGAGYWAHCGAQDEGKDRLPPSFGPAEVSSKNPEGRVDVTAVLSDAAFGETLGDRLRALADHGFLVKKWETYDHRYYRQVYEWATATGGRAILIKTPRLVVTFAPSAQPDKLGSLPPPADVAALAAKLEREKAGGRPTAVLPSPGQLQEFAQKFAEQPAWMPKWQWEHVQQLAALGREDKKSQPFWYPFVSEDTIKFRLQPQVRVGGKLVRQPEKPEDVYAAWVDSLIGRQPRGWYGFEAAKEMTQWYVYKDALPVPARDSIVLNWSAWLMPDRPTTELAHPMEDQNAGKPINDKDFLDTYYAKTGDWRGNKSFYRDGFNYSISTQNFNMTASSGALLGGALIGSERAMEDGRHGVEHFPLRLWAWSKGTSQEDIDHYYFAVTLSGQKAVADFGPTRFDRLMGQSMLAKSIEELTSAYHPGLRRFIAGSSRTSPEYLLVTQDGLQHILHTLSSSGTLHDLNDTTLPGGMPLLGHEVPPVRVATQTQTGPWAPEWVTHMVDDKQLPHEVTARGDEGWSRSYLGQNYGLASASRSGGRIQAMAQWRREAKPVEQMQGLGTLDVRYGVNTTRWANEAPGWIAPFGYQGILQHRNKMIVLTTPFQSDFLKKAVEKEGLRSLQSSIALFNYQQPAPSWEIYLDGKRVTQLPFKAKQGQRITVKDGVSYLGIIPLTANDLGRTEEVVAEEGTDQEFQKIKVRPALVINSYNLLRSDTTTGKDSFDYSTLDKTYGGFVVELGDVNEYGDFAAFQKHIQDAKLETRWEASKATVRVRYQSDADTLEAAFVAKKTQKNPPLAEAKVNGKDPYPPEGVDRETTLTQQGKGGRLEKNGAVLVTPAGVTSYLQTEPVSGTFAGFNPLPTPTPWSLQVPGGVTIKADGKLGLARVVVRPSENKLWVDYAVRPGQKDDGLAKALLVTGLKSPPMVELNGEPFIKELAKVESDGKTAYVIPLSGSEN